MMNGMCVSHSLTLNSTIITSLRLEAVEDQLLCIAEAAQTNVKRLVEIVQENAALQAKIKQNLEQAVIQSVVSVLIQSDANHDFTLGPAEIEMLVLRLNQIKGIQFDQANFRAVISQDVDGVIHVSEIMKILRNLLDDSVPEEDNIFHLQPDALLEKSK